MLKSILDNIQLVKWITELNTAAKQSLAILLIIVFACLFTIGFLFSEIKETTARLEAQKEKEIAQLKKEHAAEVTYLQNLLNKKDEEIAELTASVATCKMDAYNFINELYVEQKNLNAQSRQIRKTQLKLAQTNQRHVNSIKKDATELEKVLTTKQK